MKKTMIFLAATLLTGTAYAGGTWGENPDLAGWVVADQALLSVQQVAIKDVPLPYGEDTYGAVYFDAGRGDSSGKGPAMGVGDSYGTILHDMDIHH